MGLDRSRRRATNQELGSQDYADHQEPEVAFRAGPFRHATRESAGRTLLRGPVHRRSPAWSRISFLQPVPPGRRKRQALGLQELGSVAAALAAGSAAANTRLGQ